MKGIVERIHFIGIGGVGMAGIAEVVHNLGLRVSGSDIRDNAATIHLESLGVRVQIGHQPQWVKEAEVVVVSSAIQEDNPEIQAARDLRIPIIPRAEMLAELMRERFGIAIAGTHGKTTTTSLMASILTEAGTDPTYVIGGRLNASGTNAALGLGRYLVAEADESDASFLYLKPRMAIVTNIDEDHMETYQGDFEKLKDTFVRFIQNLPFYGVVALCWDEPVLREVAGQVSRNVISYGMDESADVRAIGVEARGLQMHFTVLIGRDVVFPVTLNFPGRHNVLNALGTIALAHKLGISIPAIQQGLAKFAGVGRRFEVYQCKNFLGHSITLVDDYGHHPTEVHAVLKTAREAFAHRRIILLFQPHRFSRMRDLFDAFAEVLAQSDLLILLDVYPAGEKPIPQFDAKALLKQIRLLGKGTSIYGRREDLVQILSEVLEDDDVVLTLGAGDIGNLSKLWREEAACE